MKHQASKSRRSAGALSGASVSDTAPIGSSENGFRAELERRGWSVPLLTNTPKSVSGLTVELVNASDERLRAEVKRRGDRRHRDSSFPLVALATPYGVPPPPVEKGLAVVELDELTSKELLNSLRQAKPGEVFQLSETSNAVVLAHVSTSEEAHEIVRRLPREPHYPFISTQQRAGLYPEGGSVVLLCNASAAVADLCREQASLPEVADMIARSQEARRVAGMAVNVIPTRLEQSEISRRLMASSEYKAELAVADALLKSPATIQAFRAAYEAGQKVADISARSGDADLLEGKEFGLPWKEVRIPVEFVPRLTPCRQWDYAELKQKSVEELTQKAPPLFMFNDEEIRLLDGNHRCELAHDQGAKFITILVAFSQNLDIADVEDETETQAPDSVAAYLPAPEEPASGPEQVTL